MNLHSCGTLTTGPVTGTWYRTVRPHFLSTVLQTGHTRTLPSRFSPGSVANPQFEVLYLTESPIVSMFEVNALLGSLHGVSVPNPHVFFTTVSVRISLHAVADLTVFPERRQIRTTVQELTGDWRCYSLRTPGAPGPPPYYSHVPTHKLGVELHNVPELEGFLTYSAKVPTYRNLVVFPSKLGATSSLECFDPNTGRTIDRIP